MMIEHTFGDGTGFVGDLETLRPGPMLAAALTTLNADGLSGSDQVSVLRGLQRMIAHLQARSFQAMNRILDATEAAMDCPEAVELGWDSAAAEIAAALRLTRRAAEANLELAQGLQRLPSVAQALQAGVIDRRRVEVLLDGTAHLSDDTARRVIDLIIGDAPRLTTGQLGAKLRRLCLTVDPDDAENRYQTAVDQRRVVAEMTPDGTANLLGLDLPPDRVADIRTRIYRLANQARVPGDTRSPDQRRADVLIDLLVGGCPDCTHTKTGGVELIVDLTTLAGLTETPAELAGMGPVVADIARQITQDQQHSPWTWTVVDPDTGAVLATGVTRRRPTTPQQRAIRARNRTCGAPGCRMPARQCDIDHTDPYTQGGPTSICNCAPLCRYHHQLKTHTPWTYQPHPHRHDYTWTSPLGRHYTTSGRDP